MMAMKFQWPMGRGADVTAENHWGQTWLDEATTESSKMIVQLFDRLGLSRSCRKGFVSPGLAAAPTANSSIVAYQKAIAPFVNPRNLNHFACIP
jgi:hypothetical protein